MVQAHELSKDQERSDIPRFRAGDTVAVNVKIIEGGRERIQRFEGVVLSRKGSGSNAQKAQDHGGRPASVRDVQAVQTRPGPA